MKHINESIIGLKGVVLRKYELTDETRFHMGHTLYHIKALKNIPSKKVKKGDLGGWIESYGNLDQKGDCWVADNAWVYDNAKVYDNAEVYDYANVYDYAKVYNTARVSGNAEVSGTARVSGNAEVSGTARVSGNAEVSGTAKVDHDYINSGKITK